MWFRNRFNKAMSMCKGNPVAGDAFNLMANGMAHARRTVHGLRQECGPDIRFIVMLKEPIEQINLQRALNRGFRHAPAAMMPACEDATAAHAHAHANGGGVQKQTPRSFSETLQAELWSPPAGVRGRLHRLTSTMADVDADTNGSDIRNNISTRSDFPPGGCAQEYVEPNLHVRQLLLLLEHFTAENIMVVFSTQFEYHPLAVIRQVRRFLGASSTHDPATDEAQAAIDVEHSVRTHGPYIAVESPWHYHHVHEPTTEEANVALCRFFMPQHKALRELLGLASVPFHTCPSGATGTDPLTPANASASVKVCLHRVPPQSAPSAVAMIHKNQSLLQTNHVILAELYHHRFPNYTFPKPTECMVQLGLSVGRGILPRPFKPKYPPSKEAVATWDTMRCAARNANTRLRVGGMHMYTRHMHARMSCDAVDLEPCTHRHCRVATSMDCIARHAKLFIRGAWKGALRDDTHVHHTLLTSASGSMSANGSMHARHAAQISKEQVCTQQHMRAGQAMHAHHLLV